MADTDAHPSTAGGPTAPAAIATRPPETLAAGRIGLDRHAPDDGTSLVDAVNRSLPELRPWMAWAAEPATAESIADFLARSSRAWDEGVGFGYAIRAADDDARIVGACDVRLGGEPGVVEIGYWVRTDRTGDGIATAAAGALTRAAVELPEVARIEIRCDAANRASRAVASKLGYRLDRIEQRPPSPRNPGETDELLVWVLPA